MALEIANEIINQLGGRQFAILTGSKNFVGSDRTADAPNAGVSFKVGSNPKKVTHVRVMLTPDDTYTVTFMAIRGTSAKTISEHVGIYNDMLRDLFEEHTGLFTSITPRR